ncbi:hypothetical protein, partial [Microcoleus sp. BROC3]|uniref:hypothetical protein n=1 Tax=Microcoleus sp. BROC3 TaxID=3055323 RepID=UPI00404078E2
GYEGLNMQVRETSIHKTSGFSSYFFSTLIKQRPKLVVGNFSLKISVSIEMLRKCGVGIVIIVESRGR